jgi:hypothetical protein
MKFLAGLLTFTVALLHIGFMSLEMFFWNAPLGHKIFGMTAEVYCGLSCPKNIVLKCFFYWRLLLPV